MLNTAQMKPFGRNLLIVLFDCLDFTKESYFLWTFLLLLQGYTSLVANIKSTAVFSEMVDISQGLLYPFCQLDDNKRSVFQVVVSVYQWSLFFI